MIGPLKYDENKWKSTYSIMNSLQSLIFNHRPLPKDPSAVVGRLAQKFADSGGSIAVVTRIVPIAGSDVPIAASDVN